MTSDAEEPKEPPGQHDARIKKKLSAPAALRNREVIAAALSSVLPEAGHVLELASGTGEHICHFARSFPNLTWHPSDIDAARLDSIRSHSAELNLPNLRPPRFLNVSDPDWRAIKAEVVLAINLLHVAPPSVSLALVRGAAAALGSSGALIVYGPFKRNGAYNAESNRRFDRSLRHQNIQWGLRDLDDLEFCARSSGFARCTVRDMPANNYLIVFAKT